jgi:GTP-binding protein HflX
MTATAPPRPRAVLLGMQISGVDDREFASALDELARLAKTLGFEVVARVTQRRARLDPGAVVGAGKLKELAEWTGGSGEVPVGPPSKRRPSEEPSDDADEEPSREAAPSKRPEAARIEAVKPSAPDSYSSRTISRRPRRATSSARPAPRCSTAPR